MTPLIRTRLYRIVVKIIWAPSSCALKATTALLEEGGGKKTYNMYVDMFAH